jgi:hypothetical protein
VLHILHGGKEKGIAHSPNSQLRTQSRGARK